MTAPSAEPSVATIADAAPPAVPAVLAAAVEQARAAVAEFSGADTVGEHLGVDYEDAAAATHRFAAQLPGYQGWQWAVVVAATPGAAHSTVSEVVLVPGPTALLAPAWVPWDQRVRPGDLSPGDLLAPAPGDERLVPGYTSSGDRELDEVAGELGLGRRWLMSPEGRADAAQRWHDGEFGPGSAMARATKRVCRDCGFYLPLAGGLGRMFGVCGNAMSADGRVVDAEYGCGAHTDTPPPPAGFGSPAFEPYDDGVVEVVEPAPVEPAPGEPVPVEPVTQAEAESVNEGPPEASVEASEQPAVAEAPDLPAVPDVAELPAAPEASELPAAPDGEPGPAV